MSNAFHKGACTGMVGGLLPWSTASIVLWALFCNWILSAQPSKPGEYVIKATYLYNIARYVEWPPRFAAAKGDSFVVCVLGQDPFAQLSTRRLPAKLSTAKASWQSGSRSHSRDRIAAFCSSGRRRTRRPPSNGTANFTATFESIARDVPEKDWESIPADLSKNLDHYLYWGQKTS
jgi:hypothetical protein